MGRRSIYHRCAFKALVPTTYEQTGDYLQGVAYCGKATHFKPAEREQGAAKRASCPKCAAALGKLILARRYAGRVKLEPAPEHVAKRFKSAWEFHLDGVLRGYIATERGFGNGWELYRLLPDEVPAFDSWRVHGGRVHGDRPSGPWDADKVADETPIQPLHYGARDAMACGAVRAVEAGLLPTPAEQREAERQRLEREEASKLEREADRERRRKEAEQREAAHAEQVATAQQGLTELAARPDLTNLERAGVEAALTLIGRPSPA